MRTKLSRKSNTTAPAVEVTIVREPFAVVEFYEGNDVVHRIAIQKPGRKISTTNGRPYETNFVAVSLEGVPLVMLDSVTRINFQQPK